MTVRMIIMGLLVLTGNLFAQGLLPPKEPQPVEVKRVEDVIKWIPKEMFPKKGRPWTQPQMDAVNAVFKKKLASEKVMLDVREKVSDIPTWNGKTQIYCEVPNSEGYFIRIFAIFSPEWLPKLATINAGDKVTIKGPITAISYNNLWNQFTLSICLESSTFEK